MTLLPVAIRKSQDPSCVSYVIRKRFDYAVVSNDVHSFGAVIGTLAGLSEGALVNANGPLQISDRGDESNEAVPVTYFRVDA